MVASSCIVLFDISNYIHRAYHSLPVEKFKRKKDDLATNAVFGTTKMMINLLNNLKWDYENIYPIACFDTAKSKLSRTSMDSSYKSQRPSAPNDLKHQFNWVRKLIEVMNIPQVEHINYEADDVIASLVKKYENENILIVSNDKDMNQLLTKPNIKVLHPTLNKYITSKEVFEKFNVIPQHFTLYQAMVGDKVDNIKGVKGIGAKTAPDIINSCNGNIDILFSHEHKHPKKKLIEEHKEELFLALKLVSLNDGLSIEIKELQLFNVKNLKNNSNFIKFMEEMEFRSIIKQYCKSFDEK